jgi:hypothetical protein
LAGFASRVWQVEQHLEAVLAAQPLGGVRGIPATPGETSKSAHVVQFFDSTVVCVHVSAVGAKATVLAVKRRFAFL